MDHNSEQVFPPTIILPPIVEPLYIPLADLMNVPGHDNGIQRFQGHNMLQNKPTGHNIEQGSGSGLLWGNEAPVGDIRIGEQGSGSGLRKANMVEAEATAAVPGRPGQKRNGESNSAKRSKICRDKKNKEVDEMKKKMQWLEEEKKRLQKENKKLQRDQKKSTKKLYDQLEEIRLLKEELAEYKKIGDEQQIVTTHLSETLVNLSYICKKKTKGLNRSYICKKKTKGLKPTRIS